MWSLGTIVALNEEAHKEHLAKEGITEEEWKRRSKELHGAKEPNEEHEVRMRAVGG